MHLLFLLEMVGYWQPATTDSVCVALIPWDILGRQQKKIRCVSAGMTK
jgi:hypothetical protein